MEHELECKTIEHYKKINILGVSGVGKSSLISLMEHYKDANFKINIETENDSPKHSLNDSDKAPPLAKTKKIKIPIKDKNNLYLNIYETNINECAIIQMNLDSLLLYTECIIIMWDYDKEDNSFQNICSLLSSIILTMKDKSNKKVPIFLIKNKFDLKKKI